MGFLKTLLILIILYYAFKFVAKYILPLFLAKAVKNMEDKMRDHTYHNSTHQQPVGKTTIDKKPQQQKSSNKEVGEYIDFEEIKE